jgi:hypothetical protein
MSSWTYFQICPDDPCDVPIDPSNAEIYTILDSFLNEVTGGAEGEGIFTEDFL